MSAVGGYSSSSTVAAAVPFDNSTNGFTATDVQAAIEEAKVTISTTEVTATVDTTTTSTTDVLIASMTITPVAGTYVALFGTSVDQSNQNVAIVLSLYAGGSLITDSVRTATTRTNAIGAVSCTQTVFIHNEITVNGSQAIEARWKTSAGTATAHQRTLTIMRVA